MRQRYWVGPPSVRALPQRALPSASIRRTRRCGVGLPQAMRQSMMAMVGDVLDRRFASSATDSNRMGG